MCYKNMTSYIDLIKELKSKAIEKIIDDNIDMGLAIIKAMQKGAETIIAYEKVSGLVRIYDTVIPNIISESDRLDPVENNLYNTLREMEAIMYITNSEITVIGLKNKT